MKFYDRFAFDGEGYTKLFHHQTWRIAMLNYIDELNLNNLSYFQAHQETDEAFVLLEGTCHLFFIDHQSAPLDQSVTCLSMEKNTVYNIPKGIYHTHALSKDAKLLIIEEENTCDDNSPRLWITPSIRHAIEKAYKEI